MVSWIATPPAATAQEMNTGSVDYGAVYAVTTVDGVLYRVYGSWQGGEPAYYAYDYVAKAIILDETGQPVMINPDEDYANLTDSAIAADMDRQIAALAAAEDVAELDAGGDAFAAVYEQTQQINAQLAYLKKVRGDTAYAAITALMENRDKLDALNNAFEQRTAALNEWVDELLVQADDLVDADALAAMNVADENGRSNAIYEAQKQSFFLILDSLNHAPAMTTAEKQGFESNERVIALRQKLDALFDVIEEKEIGYIAAQIDQMLDYRQFGAIWEELTMDADFMDYLIDLMNGGSGQGLSISPEAAADWRRLKASNAIVKDCKVRMAALTEGKDDADAYLQQKLGAERWTKYNELNASLETFNQIMTLDENAKLTMEYVNTKAANAAAGYSYSLDADGTAIIPSVAFPTSSSGSTDYTNSTYAGTIQVTFPSTAVQKKVVISIAPGLRINNNSDAGFTNTTLVNAMLPYTGQGWVNRTRPWPEKGTVLGNGEFIYQFPDTTQGISIPILVRAQIETWLRTIGSEETPAIKVDVYYDNGGGTAVIQKSVQITEITANPDMPMFSPSRDWVKTAKMDDPEYMGPDGSSASYQFKVNNSYSSVNRLVDYVEIYLAINEGVQLNGIKTGSGLSNAAWQTEDMGYDADIGKHVYKFRLQQTGLGSALVPEWLFPSDVFNLGDSIVVEWQKAVVKYWDNEQTFTITAGTKATNRQWLSDTEFSSWDMRFTETFELNNMSLVWVNSSNTITDDSIRCGETERDVYWRNDGFEDAISLIGRYALGNRKASDSPSQVVTFHFDSTDIGVTALDVPMPGNSTLTEVKYKIAGSDEWVTQSVSLQPLNANGNVVTDTAIMGKVYITNDGTLGLDINTHITDFQYVIPTVPGTSFIDSHPYACQYGVYIYGHVMTDANKTVVSTIEAHAEDDPTDTTGVGQINTVLCDSRQSYAFAGSATQVHVPGSLFVFTTRTDYANVVYPVVSPVFYIRDEFGLGVESFSLVNKAGVNLTTKYGIQPVLDHTEADGALVYKVDTSVVATQTGGDKYDALVGMYYGNENVQLSGYSHNLTITYTIAVSSDYRDKGAYGTYDAAVGGYKHMHTTRLYMTSAVPLAAASDYSRVAGTMPSDAFDANQDGDSTGTYTDENGKVHIMVSNMNETYYALQVLPQLNVQTQVKHALAPESSYLSWENGDDALQVNIGTGASFDMRTRLQNDSVNAASAAYVFQPIPKEGQYWQASGASSDDLSLGILPDGTQQGAFPWSVDLTGPATNPDPTIFDVLYGNVTPTAVGDQLMAEYNANQFVPAAQVSDWKDVNCVLFRVKDGCAVPGNVGGPVVNYDFVMNCKVSESVLVNGNIRSEIDQSIDVTTALCYEDLSANGQIFTQWVLGDSAALQLSCGMLRGTVYMDFNEDGSLSAALGEGQTASHLLDGATIDLYLARNMHSPVQSKTIGTDGTYEFSDLRRENDDYVLVVRRPAALEERYQFSVQNTTIDADGTAHHMYGKTEGGATTVAVIAVKEPGTRDEGITTGANGIYNILLTDNQMLRLRLNKTVSGEGASAERGFTFTIALTDDHDQPLTGACPYLGLTTAEGVEALPMGQCTLVDGNATFVLKHGQSVELLQLPVGTKYTITEAPITGYQATPQNDKDTVGMTEDATASFDNKREAGDVTIAKTVAGNSGDRAEYFKFALFLTDANAEATYSVNLDNASGGEIVCQRETVRNPTSITVSKESDGSGAFQSGVKPATTAAYFYLKSGESITIENIPADATYRLQEVGADDVIAKEGYTVEYQVGSAGFVKGSITPETGKVSTENTTVTFRNTRSIAVPTGIRMDVLPYVLLVVVACFGMAWLLCAKKKKKHCGQ